MKYVTSFVAWDHPLDGVLVTSAVLERKRDRWQIESFGTVRLDYLLRRIVAYRETIVLDADSAQHAPALRAAGWRIRFARDVDGAPANPSPCDMECAAEEIGLLHEVTGCDHDERAILLAAWGAVNLREET